MFDGYTIENLESLNCGDFDLTTIVRGLGEDGPGESHERENYLPSWLVGQYVLSLDPQ